MPFFCHWTFDIYIIIYYLSNWTDLDVGLTHATSNNVHTENTWKMNSMENTVNTNPVFSLSLWKA